MLKLDDTLQHAPVSGVGDCEHMRRHFMALFALVQIYDLLRVDRQPLVWVNHHAEQARISLQSINIEVIKYKQSNQSRQSAPLPTQLAAESKERIKSK